MIAILGFTLVFVIGTAIYNSLKEPERTYTSETRIYDRKKTAVSISSCLKMRR
jgi:hypothetical protein